MTDATETDRSADAPDAADLPDSARSPDKPVRLDGGEDLDDFVAGRDLALVDFYTEGCTLCRAIDPVLGNVARATDAAVGLLNPRDDLELVEAYDVRSVPTLLLFADGEPVDRMAEGFQGTEAVVAFVERRGDRE